MTFSNSSGMLDGKYNVLTSPCNEINKTTPYFKEFTEEDYKGYSTMNDYMLESTKKLAAAPISFKDKNFEPEELALLPDGAYTVSEANRNKLRYNV
jgi:hypothetical protein